MINKIYVAAYWSPTARRRYFRLSSAIRAEAVARIKIKHPTEKREFDKRGVMVYEGYHWTCNDRWETLLRRYQKIIKKAVYREMGKEIK